MQRSFRYVKQFSALYESVEAHTQYLRQMLASRPPSDELKREVESLNGLLSSFTYTNEVLQQLLDCTDATVRQERMREALKVLRLHGIIQRRGSLTELRDLSNRMIYQALALLKQAQKAFPVEANKPPRRMGNIH